MSANPQASASESPTGVLNAPTSTRRRPVFLVALNLLRVVVIIHALITISQPVTMGSYLGGDPAGLELHSALGSALGAVALLMIFVGIGYAIAGGRLVIAALLPVLFVLEGFQIGQGYARLLNIHVPLGVGVVVVAVALVVLSWTPWASRDRGARARAVPAS